MPTKKADVTLLYTFLILTILVIFCIGSIGCMNTIKAEVPSQVETCIKDSKGECSNQVEITVKHIISIELPTVFTDACTATWNDQDYPDKSIRDAGYNACVSEYINSLLEIIGNLSPTDLPEIP